MIVADTSVWIEYFRRREPCFTHMAELMTQTRVLASEAVFGELLQGARDERERGLILEHWNHLPKWDESGILIKAGLDAGRQKWPTVGLGIIDSVIVLLARETHSQIWTLDKKILAILGAGEIYRFIR